MAGRQGSRRSASSTKCSKSSMDPKLAEQLSLQLLSNAITQQQLNAAAARNQVAGAQSVLTLGVQLTHMAGLRNIVGLDPMSAAAATNLQQSLFPAQAASLQTATRAP